jgi:phosphocarrier protein HPr
MPQSSREAIVINEQGFHARPAMKFADLANTFDADIRLTKRGGVDGEPDETVDGKSIMALLTVMGVTGTKYQIDATGNTAEQAVHELVELFERKFDEE